MENSVKWSALLQTIADNGLNNQKINECDYYENNLLICGICHQPKQRMQEFPENTGLIPIKVMCHCKCEEEQIRKNKEIEANNAKKARINELKTYSLMDRRYNDANFDKFEETDHNSQNLKIGLRYVNNFEKMKESNQGLIFWGAVGTGKSYMAACIANSLIEKEVPVVMTSFIRILDNIRGNFDGADNLIRKFRNAQLVIFDDFGAERSTDYALETIYNIIDDRYRNNLPVILTTNMTMKQMREETDVRYQRIYDRVCEMCFPLQFTGPSWRKANAKTRYDEMMELLNCDD